MKKLFGVEKPLIGVVHVHALPGTPCSNNSMKDIIAHAITEALMFEESGFHSIIIENMFDRPYVKAPASPEIISAMAVICSHIRNKVQIPIGIQILASANKEALAVALASNLQFIRAEGFVFGHVADEGYTDSCAGELLRYRKNIGAEHIQIFTDIKKKHSAHAITADVSITETAHAAEFFLSDGLIITGAATGQIADSEELRVVKQAVSLPVLIGSGITPDNFKNYFDDGDGFIIGSSLKRNGRWYNSVDPDALKKMMDVYKTSVGVVA